MRFVVVINGRGGSGRGIGEVILETKQVSRPGSGKAGEWMFAGIGTGVVGVGGQGSEVKWERGRAGRQTASQPASLRVGGVAVHHNLDPGCAHMARD